MSAPGFSVLTDSASILTVLIRVRLDTRGSHSTVPTRGFEPATTMPGLPYLSCLVIGLWWCQGASWEVLPQQQCLLGLLPRQAVAVIIKLALPPENAYKAVTQTNSMDKHAV